MFALQELPTPCLLVDKGRLISNVVRLQSRLPAGVSLRIHAKTCKSIDIIKLCQKEFPEPITVSTLAEVQYFNEHGIDNIIYAVGLAPQKLTRIINLRSAPIMILDNSISACQLVSFASTHNHIFNVLLEIDCDGHRSGIEPEDRSLLDIAATLTKGRQNLLGVLTHAGSAYDLRNPAPDRFTNLAETEREAVIHAMNRLNNAGFECTFTSIGSTPTAMFCRNFSGLTEVRAGVFLFMDGVMVSLGVCEPDMIAMSVLCSVIGTRARDGAIIIDAGWSALSLDKGFDFNSWGYGAVCAENGEILPHLHVRELNQEHGIIEADDGYAIPKFTPGTLLRVLPSHACATAQNFSGYYALDNGQITDWWPRCQGW